MKLQDNRSSEFIVISNMYRTNIFTQNTNFFFVFAIDFNVYVLFFIFCDICQRSRDEDSE